MAFSKLLDLSEPQGFHQYLSSWSKYEIRYGKSFIDNCGAVFSLPPCLSYSLLTLPPFLFIFLSIECTFQYLPWTGDLAKS